MFRPAFRRSRTFALFALLANGNRTASLRPIIPWNRRVRLRRLCGLRGASTGRHFVGAVVDLDSFPHPSNRASPGTGLGIAASAQSR